MKHDEAGGQRSFSGSSQNAWHIPVSPPPSSTMHIVPGSQLSTPSYAPSSTWQSSPWPPGRGTRGVHFVNVKTETIPFDEGMHLYPLGQSSSQVLHRQSSTEQSLGSPLVEVLVVEVLVVEALVVESLVVDASVLLACVDASEMELAAPDPDDSLPASVTSEPPVHESSAVSAAMLHLLVHPCIANENPPLSDRPSLTSDMKRHSVESRPSPSPKG